MQYDNELLQEVENRKNDIENTKKRTRKKEINFKSSKSTSLQECKY